MHYDGIGRMADYVEPEALRLVHMVRIRLHRQNRRMRQEKDG